MFLSTGGRRVEEAQESHNKDTPLHRVVDGIKLGNEGETLE